MNLLGLDFYEEDPAALGTDLEKEVALGCVARTAADLVERLNPEEVILCPNADLEFLPRGVADQKVRIVGAAKTRFEEGG